MRKRRGRLYFFLPLIYIGILFGLMALQFSKNENFANAIGDMSVTYRAPANSEDKDLLDIQIRGKGLEFNLSAQKPVIIETSDGTQRKVRPFKYSKNDDNGFTVEFQMNVKLIFHPLDQSLVIQPQVPASLSAVRVTVPFSGEGGAKVVPHPYLPLAEIKRWGGSVYLSVNGGTDAVDTSSFTLGVQGGTTGTARLDPAPRGDNLAAFWLDQGFKNRLSDEQSEALLTSYLNTAYQGWKSGRFQAGTWDVGEGLPRFSGAVAAALSEEALRRGEFPAVYDTLAPYLPYHTGEWGMEAVPYLGDLMGNFQARRQILDQMAANFDAKGTMDLVGRARAYEDALFLGSPGVADKMAKYLLNSDLSKRPLREQIFLFWNLLSMGNGDSGPSFRTRLQSTLQVLADQIYQFGNGVYLLSSQGYLDLKASLWTAGALFRAAALLKDPGLKTLAWALVQSALAYRNDAGLLPETLILDKGKVVQKEGQLLPEDLYPLLGPPSRIKDVALGPGSPVIRTAADLTEKNLSAQQIRLVFQFPLGYSQHFIVQGVEPFDSIFLHDIRWRSDPYFQNYSDGWFYNSTTKTLFVKLKQRESKETVIISYVPGGS